MNQVRKAPLWPSLCGILLLALGGVALATWWQRFRDPPWIQQARQLWEADRVAEAQRLLDEHQDASGEAAAHRLYLLGAFAEERAENEGALRLLGDAAQAAHGARLFSIEINAALRLALIHLRLGRPDQAEGWMRRIEPVLPHAPALRCLWLYQRALIQQARGDLRGAQVLLEEGIAEATRFKDVKSLAEMQMARAALLRDLGRTADADRASEQATRIQGLPACRRGILLSNHGWDRVVARQALSPQDRLWGALDPAPALTEAVAIFRQECKQATRLANALTNLAHAAVVARRAAPDASMDQAAAPLRAARQALAGAQADPQMEMEWTELEGEIALGKGEMGAARAAFTRLLRMAPAQSTYEATWRALIGLARAAATEEEALSFYQQAEAHLDRRALELPLGTGRVSFLGRFERGTTLYVELLAERDAARAMEVARRARVRGLLALAQAARLDALSQEERARWEGALARYRGLHEELDRLFAQNATAAASELVPDAEMERRRERLGRELSDLIDEELRALGALVAPRQDAFRAPAPGEVLLLCFPRPGPRPRPGPGSETGARCFARDTAGVQQVALREVTPEALSGVLLPEILKKGRLKSAGRLTVLAYGAARKIAFHLLTDPLTKAPLWERLEVVYGLDLPAAAARQTERAALLLCDTAADASGACAATGQADEALKGAGWRTRLQMPKVILGGAQATPPRLNRDALLRELAQVRLFHYIGHMKAMGLRGALPLEDEAGLLTADVLTLARAPERVLLFACNSGHDGEETGGLEGLGLAQAFLLRGAAWAIAPVQEVDVALSDRLVRVLYQQGELGGDAAAPVKLLREARRAALAQGGGPAADLDAFRVFVP